MFLKVEPERWALCKSNSSPFSWAKSKLLLPSFELLKLTLRKWLCSKLTPSRLQLLNFVSTKRVLLRLTLDKSQLLKVTLLSRAVVKSAAMKLQPVNSFFLKRQERSSAFSKSQFRKVVLKKFELENLLELKKEWLIVESSILFLINLASKKWDSFIIALYKVSLFKVAWLNIHSEMLRWNSVYQGSDLYFMF